MSMTTLFEAVQKACLPGVWSKGIALARERTVIEDGRGGGEIHLRIQIALRPVTPRVTLWPDEDDWYCDCGDRNDPCIHIAAAVIALKAGTAQAEAAAAHAGTARIQYRFSRKEGALELTRWIQRGTEAEKLSTSLLSLVGGTRSGRIAGAPVSATQQDFAIDPLLGQPPKERPDRAVFLRLLPLLAESGPSITLDGEPILTGPSLLPYRSQLKDEEDGIRLLAVQDPVVSEVFSNGVVRCGKILRAIEDPGVSLQEKQWLTPPGTLFRAREIPALASEILPRLQRKMPVEILTRRLPRLSDVPPRILLEFFKEAPGAPGDEGTLSVLPRLVYGDPPIAEVLEDHLEALSSTELPTRDPAAERELRRRLREELHLSPRQAIRLEGEAAAAFVARSQGWNRQGSGLAAFETTGTLEPLLEVGAEGCRLGFLLPDGSSRRADPARAIQAWRENRPLVPLLGGGWARLPSDWLSRHGNRILALLEAQDSSGRLPRSLLPELAELSEEIGAACPDSLRELRKRLTDFESIPRAPLPARLRAELRPYQRRGYDWLHFLRSIGMGALLADDMGLGKTLQALCAIEGRSLVICPTSVLESWTGQIQRFRPDLEYAWFYGPGRKLDPRASVTLTTYGILRLDGDQLASETWDAVILDEIQTIRNPESQAARSAYALRAKFRIGLSGTPVENRLEDLWSQLQFVNPGLLGGQADFQARFVSRISQGDPSALKALHRRIRPFILRRLKKEIAPELPPRIETVLHSELRPDERETYEAILAASRQEALRLLEEGGSALGVLETLLRLRQACCDPALVPGAGAPARSPSSKIELLLENLTESIASGHRALIFSQWTSLLDRIEPELRKAGIGFLRLDGSTRDRGGVVERFQDPGGPPVMLISLKAGGVGLTLTAADHVYIMDPWWNPAVENQAADRAHRIGQENPVLIHRLVARDTVEDRVLALQGRKLQLSQAVLHEAAGAVALTREDLLALLQ